MKNIDKLTNESVRLYYFKDKIDKTSRNAQLINEVNLNLKRFKQLHLPGYQINSIDLNAFQGLTHLRSINLMDNNLTSFEADLYDQLKSLRV